MTTTATRTAVVLPVTLAGSTRPVEFTLALHGESAWSSPEFTGRIGQGAKTHRLGVHAFPRPEAELVKLGYSRRQGTLVDGPDGRTWGIKLQSTVLNRQCRATGWAEDAAATSRHIME